VLSEKERKVTPVCGNGEGGKKGEKSGPSPSVVLFPSVLEIKKKEGRAQVDRGGEGGKKGSGPGHSPIERKKGEERNERLEKEQEGEGEKKGGKARLLPSLLQKGEREKRQVPRPNLWEESWKRREKKKKRGNRFPAPHTACLFLLEGRKKKKEEPTPTPKKGKF